MVIRGNFTRQAPKQVVVPPKNPNPYIEKIAALKRKPKQQEALEILTEVSRMVAPIMKEYNFKVRNLCEFSPKNAALLGMNVNHGGKIMLRLRPHFDDAVFLPMSELLGTMLHELCHNRHGPHNADFYKLLDELTSKLEEIQVNGAFKTTGYLSESGRLGGRNHIDAREGRIKKLSERKFNEVNRLGGNDVDLKSKNLRELVREAAIRRFEDGKWCNDGNEEDIPDDDDLEIVEVVDGSFGNLKKNSQKRQFDDEDSKSVINKRAKSGAIAKEPQEIICLDADEEELIDLT